MEKEYDEITSYHYSMYRPPLHAMILQKCLATNQAFELGLDIGCGTGRSSIALSHYCKKVIGVDPSKQMLQSSTSHPNVEYQLLDTSNLVFENKSFDIITFAGSLYYAKSQHLFDETIRVCKADSQIIVYDFEIKLNQVLQYLSPGFDNNSEEQYNHEENFSGLNLNSIHSTNAYKEDLSINITTDNIVHLLLSSKQNYKLLAKEFALKDLEKSIQLKLTNAPTPLVNKIEASIYYTIYEVKK